MDIKDIQTQALRDLGSTEMPLAKSKSSNPEEVKKAATQFEAMLLQQMLSAMWQTVPKGELSGSKEEELYRDMLNQAMAEEIAENQSIGIKDVIAKDINKIDNRQKK